MNALRPVHYLYVDETSQTKHRYLGFGCMAVCESVIGQVMLGLTHSRKLELPTGEMKWSKVSSAKLNAYKLIIDRFFDTDTAGATFQFHSMFIDTSMIRDDLYNGGSRETGFNKEIFQILNKCARLYPEALFHAQLDHRDTTSSTEELRTILNNKRKGSDDARPLPFRTVQFRDSKTVQLLQLTDLLLGAVAFRMNGHHLRPDASTAKVHLSSYVLERANVRSPEKGTAIAGKFTIWHRKLEGEGPAGARSRRITD